MIAVDTSVLALALNRHAPEHARAAAALEALVNGEAPWALPWPVVNELVALVTHPHATPRPLSTAEAIGYVRDLLASPSVTAIGPTERHADTLAALVAELDSSPGKPPGLEVAAVLREHGVRELLTADRGMRRYAFLDLVDPLHGERWLPGVPPVRRHRRLRGAD